jgi:hypothetical protein
MTTKPNTPPPTSPIQIFLGKNGQTFGPYTVEQYEGLQAQADFATYKYIWDSRDIQPSWRPIEAAPAAPMSAVPSGPTAPPPPDHSIEPVRETERPRSAKSNLRLVPSPVAYHSSGIEVVFHDARRALSARVTHATDAGCELESEVAHGTPEFGSQSRVQLNLLNPKTGESMNVEGRIAGMKRAGTSWHFQVLWGECPELISATGQAA